MTASIVIWYKLQEINKLLYAKTHIARNPVLAVKALKNRYGSICNKVDLDEVVHNDPT